MKTHVSDQPEPAGRGLLRSVVVRLVVWGG
jgi:hypothetical protein